jgi:hypothetical protein
VIEITTKGKRFLSCVIAVTGGSGKSWYLTNRKATEILAGMEGKVLSVEKALNKYGAAVWHMLGANAGRFVMYQIALSRKGGGY